MKTIESKNYIKFIEQSQTSKHMIWAIQSIKEIWTKIAKYHAPTTCVTVTVYNFVLCDQIYVCVTDKMSINSK